MRILPLLLLSWTAIVRAHAAAPQLAPDQMRDFNAAIFDALGIAPRADVDTRLRAWRDDAWRRQDQGEIEGTLFVINKYRENRALPPVQRASAQALLNTAIIVNLRNNSATDATARWLVALYDQLHPPIAQGNPPLTREAANAWVDLMSVAKTGGFQMPAAEREAAIQAVARDYARASAEQQILVFSALYHATKLKAEWPSMTQQARADWSASLRNIFYPPQMNGQLQHMLNQHSFRMMQTQLNYMKQNTDTIMGSPPYFDPSCNCYKQRGGIVTEFR